MHRIRKSVIDRRSIGKRLPPTCRRLRFEPLEDRRLLSITVSTLVDEADGSIVDGDISLRDAIAAAPVGETIDFSVTGSIDLTSLGELTINKGLTINGPGAELLTIQAYNPSPTAYDGSRVFNVDDGTSGLIDVSIAGITLTGGDTDNGGGAIRSTENLFVTNSVIRSNIASFGGGGIRVASGSLTIANTTVSSNNSGNPGGGVYVQSGVATVTDSLISGNYGAAGGGLFLKYGTATITGSTISNNSAMYGGGIEIEFGDVTISGSVVSDNQAHDEGGGIRLFSGEVTVSNSSITGNTADRSGGGIRSEGTVTVIGSTISNNHVAVSGFSSGGGISSIGDMMTITDSTITGNSADFGGGLYSGIVGASVPVTISNSTISGNTATTDGGGASFSSLFGQLTVDILHSTITENQAPLNAGGGVSSYGSDQGVEVDVSSSIIAGNDADDFGVFYGTGNPFASLGNNLVGSGNGVAAFSAATNDQIGASPMLGPLAYNGGPTQTHALLPGSPAIDAGDPAAIAGMSGVPSYDQRAAPFGRVFDGDGVGGRESTSARLSCSRSGRNWPAITTRTASSTPPITSCGAKRSARPALRPTAAPMAAVTARSMPTTTPCGDLTSGRQFWIPPPERGPRLPVLPRCPMSVSQLPRPQRKRPRPRSPLVRSPARH